jgi:hypothetical protein
VGCAAVDESQLEFLIVFYKDRSRDHPCIAEVIVGITALLARWSVSQENVEQLLATLFAEVFVQGLDQSARFSMYKVMELVLDKYSAAAIALKHDFVYGYLQMIDGERDPRNLLTIFALTSRVVNTVPGWERFAEELFDVTACYYPINFKPRANDSITSELLMDALDAAMTCVPKFSEYYYPFMVEKLEEERHYLWESLVKSIDAFQDGGRAFYSFAPTFWQVLQNDAFAGATKEVTEAAYAAVTGLVAVLSKNLVTSNAEESTLDPFLKPLLAVCLAKLASPDSKESVVAGAMVCRAAQGSVGAARQVCNAVFPVLIELISSAESSGTKEILAAHVLGLIAAAISTVKAVSVPKKSHPLFGLVEPLYEVATILSQDSSSTGLGKHSERILSLLAFDTPLVSLERQQEAFTRVAARGAGAVRAIVCGMSAETQQSLVLPWLAAHISSHPAETFAGISALRATVKELPADLASTLIASPLEEAAICLGNLVNKGQCDDQEVEKVLPTLPVATLSWVARGLVLSSRPLAGKAMALLMDQLDSGREREAAEGLALALSAQENFLSVAYSNAVEKPFGRQKAFSRVFPTLLADSRLLAVGLVCQAVPTSVLLGEVEPLLPVLLKTVGNREMEPSILEGALFALSPMVEECPEELLVHIDSLFKNVSRLCLHEQQNVRKAALLFLLSCADHIEYSKIYPWKEVILSGVT